MTAVTTSLGLTLQSPGAGDRGWYASFLTSFVQAISAHDHTGAGKGLNISTAGLANNAVTGAKLRLANGEWLRARNAANSADVNVVRLSSSDIVELNGSLNFSSLTVETLQSVGQMTLGPTDGSNIQFQSGGSGVFLYNYSNGALQPNAANINDFGTSGFPWRNGYFQSLTAPTIGVNSLITSGSDMTIGPSSSNSLVFRTNNTEKWQVSNSGQLIQHATQGSSLKMTRAGTTIQQSIASVSSAGTTTTDATLLTTVFSSVTSVASSEGVRLWDPIAFGTILYVAHTAGAASIKLYPPTGAFFAGSAANVAVTLTLNTVAICVNTPGGWVVN